MDWMVRAQCDRCGAKSRPTEGWVGPTLAVKEGCMETVALG